jgi:hypothetical protein
MIFAGLMAIKFPENVESLFKHAFDLVNFNIAKPGNLNS